MRISYIDRKDSYWAASIQLSLSEWPPISRPWEGDEWMDRPIRRWAVDHFFDCCFTCNGMVLFRRRSEAEWFRMVWEQVS
jgi:hypothetical protein